MNNRHPLINQINTRVYLNELSQKLGSKALINDIPDEELLKWNLHNKTGE